MYVLTYTQNVCGEFPLCGCPHTISSNYNNCFGAHCQLSSRYHFQYCIIILTCLAEDNLGPDEDAVADGSLDSEESISSQFVDSAECPAVPDLVNGKVTYSDALSVYSIVTFTCNDGYTLIGKPMLAGNSALVPIGFSPL